MSAPFHTLSTEDVLASFGVAEKQGRSDEEVQQGLRDHGKNRLQQRRVLTLCIVAVLTNNYTN